MKKLKLPLGTLLCAGLFLFGCETAYQVNDPGNLVPKTVDQDGSLPSIAVNGIRLHAEAFGNPTDPLVIVLHAGPGGDYRSLMNCKDLVAQGYRTVFYDQRGTG